MSMRAPVQVRGGGFGLDAELARKAAERYDYGMENEARGWLETISEMQIGDDFGDGLRDGIILCTVANKIHSSVIKRVEIKSKMPFCLWRTWRHFLKLVASWASMNLICSRQWIYLSLRTWAMWRAVSLHWVVLKHRNYPEFSVFTLVPARVPRIDGRLR
ncbi:unnamed protein product [Peronospora destructor]|uniref:Calponin-homology (CH) domain-containing protein n=1 Tax=Peronospora destructor TaxID=86335 RepID=A0AAV0TRG6_9STRA|nr:unnamed protein product [Peronospora destructor]